LNMVCIVGLSSALFGDGIWDAGSWLALAVPLGVIGRAWFGAGRSRRDLRKPLSTR
jgi:hypothetical protein